MRAVLDANVIVSAAYAFARPSSGLARILRSGIRGRYHLLTSDYILDEVRSVLSRPFFTARVPMVVVEEILDGLERRAEKVAVADEIRGIAAHWQDDRVLETALKGEADYLVTGDKELLAVDHPLRFRIVHPNEFLTLLDQISSDEE